MPQLPSAHTANVVASGLLIEAFVLAGGSAMQAAPAFSIAPQQAMYSFLLWAVPACFLIAGSGLFAKRAWAWWLALVLVLLVLLTTPSQLTALFRLFARGSDLALLEPRKRLALLTGFALLMFARTLWHLMLALGLLRLDVRARVGVNAWSPARAVAAAASAGAGLFVATLVARLGLGL
jgi:hypothetical protein